MLEYIKIEGYKSIKSMELELKPINVFIGSNGSGKSNFISFFNMVHSIFNRNLQRFVIEEKVDNILYFGRKRTENLIGKLVFSHGITNLAYRFILSQTKDGGLYINEEASGMNISLNNDKTGYNQLTNNEESKIVYSSTAQDQELKKYLERIQIYHFHDTSSTSLLRRECDINDNQNLKSDGRNLPAFLYYLKQTYPKRYRRLEKTIQSVAPYIDHFILEPKRLNKNEIELRWVEKGDLDSNFSAYNFSDGTLRFIALATVLMQPEPPQVILIDEPELGLHPKAIVKLTGMIEAASTKTQLIISTQSVNLVDYFNAEDIVTVDRNDDGSIFKRLNTDDLQAWLEDHSLGELWERNIINSAQPFTK